MTRFQKEISGELGEFWKREAKKRVESVQEELRTGFIKIDGNGVARNYIGRVIMDDLAEIVEYITPSINRSATAEARDSEVEESLSEYRSQFEDMYEPSDEEIYEMQTAFGKGNTVVNIITGKTTQL